MEVAGCTPDVRREPLQAPASATSAPTGVRSGRTEGAPARRIVPPGAKTEIPLGEAKWLTVVSPEAPDGVELLLEPNSFPPAQTYQRALREAGIPATSFAVEDVRKESERMIQLGVVFKTPPTRMGPVTVAVFEDTCGNLIQIVQQLT